MTTNAQVTVGQGEAASWWPSRYGADDEAGALNEISPGKVVRFGTDPATSALDLNCKLHELDNVYVVDASFFVSATAVNPTLTIIANALRVADHIADRLGAAPQRDAESPLVPATGVAG